MATDEKDIWKELRKPFDPKVVGTLPRGGIQLDYVGHAAVTDRLLSVDPAWSWEPLAIDDHGLPALDGQGNLWIKLTVNGVTRIGVGDGKNAKERIGDALRNAAMRFGVALDLWTKDELESHLDAPELRNEKPSQQKPATAPQKALTAPAAPPDAEDPFLDEVPSMLTASQVAELLQLAKAKGYTDKAAAVKFLNDQSGLPDFRNTPESEFAGLKKVVIESGWVKDAA